MNKTVTKCYEYREKGNNNVSNKKTSTNVEIWADLVNIKDLLLSITICLVFTLGAYFIAPNKAPMPLFFGLGGAVVGFILTSCLIKPKRIVKEESDGDHQ